MRSESQRGLIGTQYENNRISDMTQQNHYGHHSGYEDQDMSGEGLMDIARGIMDGAKKAGRFILGQKDNIVKGAKIAQDAYTSEVGTAIRNAIPSSDDTARDGFAGERHAILQLKNGRNGVANYMGPDTALLKRLKRGDRGRTAVDEVSRAHDIRYALAKTQADIRKADNKMIRAVKQIEQDKLDNPRNILLAKAITGKKMAEDLGILRRDAFSGDLSKNPASVQERNYLSTSLAPLEQKGYGLKPAGGGMPEEEENQHKVALTKLRTNIAKQMKKKKIMGMGSKNPSAFSGHTSMSKTYPTMKNYKMIGSGGMYGKGAIVDLVGKKIVPVLMKAVGIPVDTIPVTGITKIISKAVDDAKSGNLVSVVASLSKHILPMLTALKMKALKLPIKGGGITKLLGKKENILHSGLVKILMGTFKDVLSTKDIKGKGFFGDVLHFYKSKFSHKEDKRMRDIEAKIKAGRKKKGGGLNISGKGFFEDFANGFKSIFKPLASIAGPILDAVGLPEFGIPLSAVGSLL